MTSGPGSVSHTPTCESSVLAALAVTGKVVTIITKTSNMLTVAVSVLSTADFFIFSVNS
jgi:hypothetical protein